MSKKAIIVGASSGIGKALAIELVKQDYSVGITGRRKKELEEIQKVKPEAIHILASDVTQATATTALDQLLKTLDGLDLFIFSAGVGYLNEKLDYDLENRTNQLNVVAFTKIMSWIIPFFQKQGHGHVVNISSVAQHRGSKLAPAYNASKAYQTNYLEGLHQKMFAENRNIHITDIRPGFVDTAMAQGDGLFWVASKEKAAKQIYRAIKKKKAVAYISKRWVIIGRLLALLPKGVYKRL